MTLFKFSLTPMPAAFVQINTRIFPDSLPYGSENVFFDIFTNSVHVLLRCLEKIQYYREQYLIQAQGIKYLSKKKFIFKIPLIIQWNSISSSTLFGNGMTDIYMFSRSLFEQHCSIESRYFSWSFSVCWTCCCCQG